MMFIYGIKKVPKLSLYKILTYKKFILIFKEEDYIRIYEDFLDSIE